MLIHFSMSEHPQLARGVLPIHSAMLEAFEASISFSKQIIEASCKAYTHQEPMRNWALTRMDKHQPEIKCELVTDLPHSMSLHQIVRQATPAKDDKQWADLVQKLEHQALHHVLSALEKGRPDLGRYNLGIRESENVVEEGLPIDKAALLQRNH